MGCIQEGCEADEGPVRQVEIAKFKLTESEITQAQYEAVAGANPSFFQPPSPSDCPECTVYEACPDCPVETVDWDEARRFCETVGGRLPTEAEWEYAARAGNPSQYACGDDETCLEENAWFAANADQKTHPVRTRDPNRFGLYDMLGNVWEWVLDCYSESHARAPADGTERTEGCLDQRVIRGGGWLYGAPALRVSSRAFYAAGFRDALIGFRCAKDVE